MLYDSQVNLAQDQSMDLVFSRTKKIPNKSWGQECSLCSSRHGVPIECSQIGCKQAYHTTCAIRGKLKMQAIFGKNFKGGIKLRSYCKEHSPSASLDNGQDDKIDANGVREIDMTNLADDLTQDGANEELDFFWKYVDINEVHKNISDAYTRGKRLKGTSSLDTNISKKLKKTDIKHEADVKPNKKEKKIPKNGKDKTSVVSTKDSRSSEVIDEVDPLLIDLIYRYWMLLRTANNGQSLIKFSPTALKEREFEQKKNILKLRIELERVRNLSYMIGKREKLKGAWLKAHQNIIKRTFSVINDLNPAIELPNSIEVPDNATRTTSSSANNANVSSTNTGTSASLINNHHHNNATNHHTMNHNQHNHVTNIKKSQPLNGRFDESDQLINDLIDCDHIYELPANSSHNSNLNNLDYQERSTLERRKTLSLVRRINRQLKSFNNQTPPMNPYAKSYLLLKRDDSPTRPANSNQPQTTGCATSNLSTAKTLKFR